MSEQDKTKVIDDAQKREDMLLDMYKIHAYIPNDAEGNPLTPFGNFSAGYEAAAQHYEREHSLDNKSASELLEMSALPFDKACLMVRDMEREIADLKERLAKLECLEHDDELIIETLKSQKHQITELSAQVNQLREALEAEKEHSNILLKGGGEAYIENCTLQAHINQLLKVLEFYAKFSDSRISEPAKIALSTTAPQCPQAFEDEVIERCAKVVENGYFLNDTSAEFKIAQSASKAIRALKSK